MTPEPSIRVNVDVTNPGQFLACCGLLELADRLWEGAEGWFDESLLTFCVSAIDAKESVRDILSELETCELKNTMNTGDLQRRDAIQQKSGKERTKDDDLEKKRLDKLRRELPLVLEARFDFQIDWYTDSKTGGNRYKTWAGQQSVIDIAQAMKSPIEAGEYRDVPQSDWISHSCGSGVDFNFDSDCSVQSSALDVGFVLDPLQMGSEVRPLLQFLAFVGLQRFRPAADSAHNAYTYFPWTIPLPPEVAACIASGAARTTTAPSFTFPLLYRTKYLKSFLPAKMNGE